MHYKEFFLKKKNIINQEIFNKKINWFFDIKSISHNKIKKKYVHTYASQLIADYKKIKKSNYLSKKSTTIKVKPLDKFLKNNKSNIKINGLLKYIKNQNLNEYFNYFLIQGSFASNDYVLGWSDIDTWTVIKDEVLKEKKN